MNGDDRILSNFEFESIVAKLPSAEAEKLREMRKASLDFARKAAVPAIMARNFSHGIGSVCRESVR